MSRICSIVSAWVMTLSMAGILAAAEEPKTPATEPAAKGTETAPAMKSAPSAGEKAAPVAAEAAKSGPIWIPSTVRPKLEAAGWDSWDREKQNNFVNGRFTTEQIQDWPEQQTWAYNYLNYFRTGRLPAEMANALKGEDRDMYIAQQQKLKNEGKQVGPAPGEGGGSYEWVSPVLMVGGIVALMYFMIIRPQKKQQKEKEKMMTAITKGVHVVTIGGMRGLVVRVNENDVTLCVDKEKKIHVTYLKSAIGHVTDAPKDEKEADASEKAPEKPDERK